MHERSPIQPGLGPRAFRHAIQKVQFPVKVRSPANISMYGRSSNLGVWLEDYGLACWTAGIKDDHLIIHFLPIHLAEETRAWLEHLPTSTIHNWVDLQKAFIRNFEGPTSALEALGASRGAPRKVGKAFGITSRGFPRKVMSSSMPSTPT
jgi:hypothetical protein